MSATSVPGDSPYSTVASPASGQNGAATRQALARIDAALARIEAAASADSLRSAAERAAENAAALEVLRQRHGALRIATAGALSQIDSLIEACDATAGGAS